MEEREHIIEILEQTQGALKTNNVAYLQNLSNQTIHSASIHQHTDYILIAVIIYTLNKLAYRKEQIPIKNWENFTKKINGIFSLAVESLKQNKSEAFSTYLEKTLNTIKNLSVNLKPYVQEVLRKASINKASKIYEHGISLGRTAKLLGLSQWELTEYIGQKNISEIKYNQTLNIKTRAKMAMEFFA